MQGIIVIIVIIAACIMLKFFTRSKINNTGSWFAFYTKGTDAGFTFNEIEQLRHLADKCRLEDIASIFYNEANLDLCIRDLVQSQKTTGKSGEKGAQDFLSKIYEFRKKVEMDKSGNKSGISNSRQVIEGQNLRIQLEGYGVFKSQVFKNTSQHIIISKPNSGKMPGIFSWLGQKISIYFWRDQDAGYVFDTEVIDEIMSQGIACLKISHSDSLARTQKRKSIRVKVRKPAFLYHIKSEEEARNTEVKAGLKCLLEDISDTGCALTVGGKANAGLRVKVQFTLSKIPIVMPGTVRSTEYKADKNQSLLHIEADPLPIEIRNQIMGEIFGLLPEDEDDLPFRILEDEAGKANSADDIDAALYGQENVKLNALEDTEAVFGNKNAV